MEEMDKTEDQPTGNDTTESTEETPVTDGDSDETMTPPAKTEEETGDNTPTL